MFFQCGCEFLPEERDYGASGAGCRAEAADEVVVFARDKDGGHSEIGVRGLGILAIGVGEGGGHTVNRVGI